MNKQQAHEMIKNVFDQLKLTAAERLQLYKALEVVSSPVVSSTESDKKVAG